MERPHTIAITKDSAKHKDMNSGKGMATKSKNNEILSEKHCKLLILYQKWDESKEKLNKIWNEKKEEFNHKSENITKNMLNKTNLSGKHNSNQMKFLETREEKKYFSVLMMASIKWVNERMSEQNEWNIFNCISVLAFRWQTFWAKH